MRRVLLCILIFVALAMPVNAMEATAPPVPESAEEIMPQEGSTFSDGLMEILRAVIPQIRPVIMEGAGVCLGLMAIVLLLSLLENFDAEHRGVVQLGGAVAIGILLLNASGSLIDLGVQTVQELSEYGKLLLPVMTTAMAAQGGAGTSAALYTGTAIFDAVLSSVISRLIVPMLYVFLCLAIAVAASEQESLKKLRDFIKWLMTWSLKIVLYVFTGYLSITGVVSGSVDAAAIKAAKLTISGVVPVVGGILSDASETVLVSAGLVKNAVGIYGMLAVIALWVQPFLRIGAQYLLLKLTGAVSSVFASSAASKLIQNFSEAMGLLVAMTGTVCLMLLISTVCFMRGVA